MNFQSPHVTKHPSPIVNRENEITKLLNTNEELRALNTSLYERIEDLNEYKKENEHDIQMQQEKHDKLEHNLNYLSCKYESEKRRCLKFKRKITALQEDLVVTRKELTVAEVKGQESKRRIVGYEESEKALAQKSFIESAIRQAMEENNKKENCVVM